MNLDNLNNSQLILLVLLIALVTSAAMAVATLAVLYERIAFKETVVPQQPTVIQQTVNRIIERERVLPADEQDEVTKKTVTLDVIESSFEQIYFGSQPVTVGFLISSDGMLVAARRLETQRRYSIRRDDILIPFVLVRHNEHYSLLKPEKSYTPEKYVPIEFTPPVMIGQSSLIYGGFGEETRLHSEIVSQKRTESDGVFVRTSINPNEASLPSVVLVNNTVIGFLTDVTGWMPIINVSLLEGDSEEEPPVDIQ